MQKGPMENAAQERLIARSGLFDPRWYLRAYPDVARAGMDPLQHFLTLGAAMGRNPGPQFDTKRYLRSCHEGIETGLNPVAHSILHGRAAIHQPQTDARSGLARLDLLRGCLLTLGFTDQPLAEMADIAAQGSPALRRCAALELAQWHMRAGTPEGHRAALRYIERARADGPGLRLRSALLTLELLCLYHLNEPATADIAFHREALAGALSADALLVRANFQTTAQARLATINVALGRHGIAPLALRDTPGAAHDRLTTATPVAPVSDGPLVSVLITALDAAQTLPTALRTLQAQSWQNLDIIVLAGCNQTKATHSIAETFAADDPRIRVIRLAQDDGPYGARNHGLDIARGEFVTALDADAWAHPLRIETQMRFMAANPQVIGCTTRHAHTRADLGFVRWTGAGKVIVTDAASLLFRRAPVQETLGYWDTVCFGADREMIRRMRRAFGPEAVVHLPSGPLVLHRDCDSPGTTDPVQAVNDKAYQDAQRYHHTRRGPLRYGSKPSDRPFPAPALMRVDRPRGARHLPLVLASDFRMIGGSVKSCLEEIRFSKERGLTMGLVEMYRYDLFDRDLQTGMLPEVRALIDGEGVQQLTHGEEITCDLLLLRYPPILEHPQRYLPRIKAREIRVIVNQPPMSDYSTEGVRRYSLGNCAANLRDQFGKDALWHPIGPLVREALHRHHADALHHIRLADDDWHNIIDLRGWASPPRARKPGDPLRIGRHSRDHAHKWPASREEILAAYPARPDVSVHVLGGASAPRAILGGLPANWVVHPFGTVCPRAFLADIDVFIYFSHPGWIESFGRTIIEAMAVGRPVILPAQYRPLFEDAALYATPQTALSVAQRLADDPHQMAQQIERAQAFVAARFSHETHAARLQALGVNLPS